MKIKRDILICKRCLGRWMPKGIKKPKNCPKCHSPYWFIPRRREIFENILKKYLVS